MSYSLFVAKDLAVYECQTGWGELPPLYNDSLIECNKDLSQTTEVHKLLLQLFTFYMFVSFSELFKNVNIL